MPSHPSDWFELLLRHHERIPARQSFSQENKMINITRLNPLEVAFENLLRGAPVWLPSPEAREPEPMQFRMDVVENDKEYQVRAELPGVKKEEISITISGNEVAVSAEVKDEKDVKSGETVICAERYYGKIQRGFALGHEVDEATAQAKYNDGVLELTLPKKTVAAAKKLAVH
jgi:HSP20 family protein